MWRDVTCAVLLVLALAGPMAAGEARPIDWAELADPSAQDFEDPFRDLSGAALSDLITVVRLRDRLEEGGVADEARPRLEARLAEKEAALGAAGIDIDWLMAQRWAVAERRRAAAVAVNAALDGQPVEISGFLIPAPPSGSGQAAAYLVPQRGMCSHTPPPPPNQLLRLVLADAPGMARLYAPVTVRGTLLAEETRQEMIVVDGPVRMWSAWTLEAESLSPLSGHSE